ncbi:MAG: YitT family protein [Actinomycetales bacterium]
MTSTVLSQPQPLAVVGDHVSRHSPVEDAAGLVTGTLVVSLGLALLHAGGLVTGGTAGLALLLCHVVATAPFGLVYLLVTLPFVVLAVAAKGWGFVLRSALSLVLVAGFTAVHAAVLPLAHVPALYAALVGNVAAGVGMLILFRHASSLGGFNVIALVAQERRGWRAGYVQLVLDGAVVALSAAVVPPRTALLSAVGAVVVNLILAMNHRPGRYLAQ